MKGGRFEGDFEKGKYIRGTFYFDDGLDYDDQDWKYCSEEDPRFWCERQEGISIKGPLKYPCANPRPPRLPLGCYDTIDGYFDPKAGCVREYFSHHEIRRPDPEEIRWIQSNCRVGK